MDGMNEGRESKVHLVAAMLLQDTDLPSSVECLWGAAKRGIACGRSPVFCALGRQKSTAEPAALQQFS